MANPIVASMENGRGLIEAPAKSKPDNQEMVKAFREALERRAS